MPRVAGGGGRGGSPQSRAAPGARPKREALGRSLSSTGMASWDHPPRPLSASFPLGKRPSERWTHTRALTWLSGNPGASRTRVRVLGPAWLLPSPGSGHPRVRWADTTAHGIETLRPARPKPAHDPAGGPAAEEGHAHTVSEAQDVNTRGRNTRVKEKTPSEDEADALSRQKAGQAQETFSEPDTGCLGRDYGTAYGIRVKINTQMNI